MFTTLFPLLKDPCDSITITLARESDTHARVNILPRLSHPNQAVAEGLKTPVSLTATPEELDSPAFLEALSHFTASATALADVGAGIEAEHKRAADAAKEKAKPVSNKPNKPNKADKAAARDALPPKKEEPVEDVGETEPAAEPAAEGLGL